MKFVKCNVNLLMLMLTKGSRWIVSMKPITQLWSQRYEAGYILSLLKERFVNDVSLIKRYKLLESQQNNIKIYSEFYTISASFALWPTSRTIPTSCKTISSPFLLLLPISQQIAHGIIIIKKQLFLFWQATSAGKNTRLLIILQLLKTFHGKKLFPVFLSLAVLFCLPAQNNMFSF